MTRLTRRAFTASAAALAAFPAKARSTPWEAVASEARALDQCRSLVIHLDGAPVVEEAFRGPGLDQPAQIKSVSKTVVAALTGAALDRGEIPSLEATLAEVAPRLIPRRADPRVSAISVEQLVTMRAGLEWTSGANYGAWVGSPDWVADALSRPFVAKPGGPMLYSTGSFHILGAVLSEVSGESLLSLARSRLGAPLGIGISAWTRDPQGRYLGGDEMAMRPTDMVRFGELYRSGGEWGGVRVLSRDWVERSLKPRTRSPLSGLDYGYGWLLGGRGRTAYALARGYGGQVILIAPGVGLTAAITSDPTLPARSGGYFGDLMALIEGAILPVARAETA
jgi:CubicO group peptidase (beta-lactamase class C family)